MGQAARRLGLATAQTSRSQLTPKCLGALTRKSKDERVAFVNLYHLGLSNLGIDDPTPNHGQQNSGVGRQFLVVNMESLDGNATTDIVHPEVRAHINSLVSAVSDSAYLILCLIVELLITIL